MSGERILLGLKASDLPHLLEAVESMYENVVDECDRPDCQSCGPKIEALNRIRFALLENAPKIMVK